MPIWLAFVISVVLLAPAFGLVLDRYLFRKIPNSNTTAKLVTGITLFVGIPALLPVIFGSKPTSTTPRASCSIRTPSTSTSPVRRSTGST